LAVFLVALPDEFDKFGRHLVLAAQFVLWGEEMPSSNEIATDLSVKNYEDPFAYVTERWGGAVIGTFAGVDLFGHGFDPSILLGSEALPDILIGLMTISLAAASLFFVVAQQASLAADQIKESMKVARVFKADFEDNTSVDKALTQLTNNLTKEREQNKRRHKTLVKICLLFLYGFMFAFSGLLLRYGFSGVQDITGMKIDDSLRGILNMLDDEGALLMTAIVGSITQILLATLRAMKVMADMAKDS